MRYQRTSYIMLRPMLHNVLFSNYPLTATATISSSSGIDSSFFALLPGIATPSMPIQSDHLSVSLRQLSPTSPFHWESQVSGA